MRKTFSINILVLSLLLACNTVFADDIRVTAELDSSEYLIGDWIPLRIIIEHSANVEVYAPSPSEKDSGNIVFIGLERYPAERKGDNVREKWTLNLAAYDTASGLIIPGIPIHYHTKGDSTIQTALTDELTVSIVSAGGDTLSKAHDIKPQMEVARGLEDYLPYIILFALIILGVAGYFIWKKYFKKDHEQVFRDKPAIKIDPYDKAIRRITELKAKKLWEKGHVKEYFFETTEILREYIEDEFGIPAMEMTTDDIIFSEDILKILDRKELEQFLRNSDLVKFAKFIPGSEECAAAVEKTYSLVKEARSNKPRPEIAESVTDMMKGASQKPEAIADKPEENSSIESGDAKDD